MTTPFLKKLGAKVKEQRVFCSLTQPQLAAAIGVHRSSIHHFEHGRSNSISLLLKVADALGLHACELLAMVEDVNSKSLIDMPREIRIDLGSEVLICTEVRRV